MAVDKFDGTENMRANETAKSGSITASPSGTGKPAGGTDNMKAQYQCFEGPAKASPTGGSGPSLPDHYSDGAV